MGLMTIGQLALQAGVGVETVRYYERRRLLSQPKRPNKGYRRYGEDEARRIQFIKRAQKLGFTLEEIAELLALRVESTGQCADVRHYAEEKIADIEERLKALRGMKKTLQGLVEACRQNKKTEECPILAAWRQSE